MGKWFDFVADMEKFFKEKKWQFRFLSFPPPEKCLIAFFVVQLVIMVSSFSSTVKLVHPRELWSLA